ncbi:unnamed protein product [marine sediment metagenome]|uniref:Uncharacterized protein n=1 Tax=marine sediment metagenome TaxID=412755 RepID=X1J660_9ZZZZ
MSRKKGNGNDILNKLLPTLIEVPRNDPKYMPDYMKLRRRDEKLLPFERTPLELKAESLLEDMRKLYLNKSVL